MDGHHLDNPAWHALSGPHAGLAETHGPFRCYPADIAVFAAMERITPGGIADLARALAPGRAAAVLGAAPMDPPAGVEVVLAAELLQMHAPEFRALPPSAPLVELAASDAPAMLELVELTRPGPFARRTHEMGRYLGIREEGRLVAMAGERLRLAGFTEVSAVATHPEVRGRGYARMLVSAVGAGIVARGETPFLHVYPHNEPAIRAYAALGFVPRRAMHLLVLRRPAG